MPHYLSLHTLACLTRQGAGELARRLEGSDNFRLGRLVVNLTEGKMVVEVDAPGREAVEGWFAREKFHCDWLLRIEEQWQDGKLVLVP